MPEHLPKAADGTQESPAYEVGYRKPPAAHKFKKGHPGCGGRPKRQRNIPTVMNGFLDERITFHEGKRRRTMSKRDAICLRIANDAVSGNDKAQMKAFALTESPESFQLTKGKQGKVGNRAVTPDDAATAGSSAYVLSDEYFDRLRDESIDDIIRVAEELEAEKNSKKVH